MRRFWATLLISLLLSGWGMAQTERKRIAVLDFDFAGVQQWWGGYQWDIGAGIADIVIRHLVEDGTYRVIERRALNALLAEQNFSTSDRADPSSAAQIGRLLGVDAIVIGSITQFGTESRERSVGGAGGTWRRLGGGRVGTSEGKAVVALDARVVDVDTGEVLVVTDGEAESSRSGLLLGGGGRGPGGFGTGSINMSSSDFRETILGEATHEAAEKVAHGLIGSAHRIPTKARPIRGLVAFAEGNLVILNVGSDQGVAPGMELSVERVQQVVKDPATGRVLREITGTVARVRVTSVDAGSSEATVISGSGIEVGDIVKD